MNTPIFPLWNSLLVALLLTTLPAAQAQPAFASGEPEKSLTAAHDSFVKKDMDAAARHIHNAALIVKNESKKVSGASKVGMHRAGDELDRLGRDVKAGTVKSDAAVKRTFAKVDHQMAECWHKTAVESKKSGQDATADLKKAGESLAGAAKWSGYKLSEGTKASVDGIKKASIATDKDVKTRAADVDKWFKGIGDGIEDLGRKL